MHAFFCTVRWKENSCRMKLYFRQYPGKCVFDALITTSRVSSGSIKLERKQVMPP